MAYPHEKYGYDMSAGGDRHNLGDAWLGGSPVALEADDFILGPSADSIVVEDVSFSRRVEQAKVNRTRTTQPGVVEGDLLSIGELIADTLGDPVDSAKVPERAKAPEKAEVSKPAKAATLTSTFSAFDENILGEEFEATERAMKVYQQCQPEVARISELTTIPEKDVEDLLIKVRDYQKVLRAEQSQLQEIVARFIRDGAFQRVASVDAVKRKIEDLLLLLRSLENRVHNKSTALMTDSYVDGASVHDIIDEAITGKAPSLEKGKKAKKAKSASVSYEGPSPWARRFKVAVLFFFLALIPIGYHLSANWNVTPAARLEIAPFRKILPLTSAIGVSKNFQASVEDSWKTSSAEEKQMAAQQLAAILKVQGFEHAFISYPTKGVALIMNLKTDKTVIP